MNILALVLMLASLAAGQVFPEDMKDPGTLRNMEFLYDETAKVKNSVTFLTDGWAASSSFTFINNGTSLAANNTTVCQATVPVTVDAQAPLMVSISGARLGANSQAGHACDIFIDGVASGRRKYWYFNTSGLNFDTYVIPVNFTWFFGPGVIAAGARNFCVNCYDPGVVTGTFYGTTEFAVWSTH